MSARFEHLVRGLILFFLFTVILMLASNLQAFASIDIRDLDNSESINVQVTQERTRIQIRTRTNHDSSRAPTQYRQQTDARPVGDGSRVNNSVSRFDIGPIATMRCALGVFVCDLSILADRPADPISETVPPPAAAPAAPQVVAEPVEIVITTSDLLELIPATPQILMDRGPFGLKNAHTNFYASDHQAQTVTQTMFGQEVTIVATPVEYRWDYGDGNTLVTESPGRPVEVFNTETETSHQYTEPGLYTVTMTTVFAGTYQVDGGPTQTVSSTVTQQAEPVEIRIWRAVTRNVDQTCAQNPNAWGC